MDSNGFQKMKSSFQEADVDGKIEIYVSAEGLSQDQYKELLRMFPLGDLHRLEEALQ